MATMGASPSVASPSWHPGSPPPPCFPGSGCFLHNCPLPGLPGTGGRMCPGEGVKAGAKGARLPGRGRRGPRVLRRRLEPQCHPA